MFRQLNENDYAKTMDFLGKNPGLNLFQIGDIENYGFDSEIQTVWGSFNENEELTGVLLRYRDNYIPYFKDEELFVSKFREVIQNDERANIISGEAQMVSPFKSCFERYHEREMYFCELKDNLSLKTGQVTIKLATPDDAERIFDLLLMIEEFDTLNRNSADHVRQKLEDQSGRIYFIENEKKEVICTAQTAAENSKSAMVVSVATRKDYRRQGLMTQVLSKLCQDLLNEQKTLCLFYDNPEAGAVYHKLGFKTIGKWKMIVRQP
ncbi:MAG: GNAT family N-acetyltransferase [Turicibacter sp.]|nr:GNAT family N-acetyltransferase [Turicibacter sp.]